MKVVRQLQFVEESKFTSKKNGQEYQKVILGDVDLLGRVELFNDSNHFIDCSNFKERQSLQAEFKLIISNNAYELRFVKFV